MGRAWVTAAILGTLVAAITAQPADPDRLVTSQRPEDLVLQGPDAKGKEPPKKAPAKELPKPKSTPKAKEPIEPDAFARAPESSGEAPESSFSRMMGDWIGVFYADTIVSQPGYQITLTSQTTTQFRTLVVVGANGVLRTIRVPTTVPAGNILSIQPTLVTTRARVPVLTGGGFKIAENERPLPEDRVFLTYNNFQNVLGPAQLPSLPVSSVVGGNQVLTQSVIAGGNSYVQREVVGFETTFLDGMASFGMRAPFYQLQGDGSVSGSDFGDLSFIFKVLAYSFGSDGVAGGLVVTVPTGPGIQTIDGDIRSFRIQPWVGGVVSAGDLFAVGFLSVAVPTDSRDVTLLFTDIQVGYMLYNNPFGGLITYVAPVSELHITNPLNHRDGNGPISVPDLVILTEGLQVGLGRATSVSLGLGVPVTGPRPFDLEAMIQINVRY